MHVPQSGSVETLQTVKVMVSSVIHSLSATDVLLLCNGGVDASNECHQGCEVDEFLATLAPTTTEGHRF